MTPLDYYHQQAQQGVIQEDPNQLVVMQHLHNLYNLLINEQKKREGLFTFWRRPKLVKGLYLWGGVGIGKTFMMDCFFQSLPFPNKLRMHFYQFMQQIHKRLTNHQGEKNPLDQIAKEIATNTLVLCFDELFVSDITDAMLLSRLFNGLFSNGVCLIATSNVAPDNLYKNGLQREQFIPTIDFIKKYTNVISIPTQIDYRLRHLKEAGVFYTPLNDETSEKMERSFRALTEGKSFSVDPIEIAGRSIRIKKQVGDIIWFDFTDLCSVPRSQQDYLKIAEQYRIVFISDIPVIQENEKDRICLFISMVDVFYDKRVRLVISAAESVPQLYHRGYMILEYTRTHSRLLEMQSTDYFSSEF